jgi:hypothetical protein
LCGIFGAIGTNWNLGIIRALAICNEDRGNDSLGFFDSTGKMIKAAVAPTAGLRQQNICEWLEFSKGATWFVAGHTRQATRGSVNRKNSHPFRYGRIIGAHNGMVDAPNSYTVDSQYLFDTLAKAKGNYNRAWADVVGYWGLSWFDGSDFYLQVHNGELHYGYYDGCLYYSSSEKHLASCIGCAEIKKLAEGETLKCSEDGTVTFSEPFVSTAPEFWGKRYGASNARDLTKWWHRNDNGASAGYTPTPAAQGAETWETGYQEDRAMAGLPDYEKEWSDAWAEYEHSYDDNDNGH